MRLGPPPSWEGRSWRPLRGHDDSFTFGPLDDPEALYDLIRQIQTGSTLPSLPGNDPEWESRRDNPSA